MGGKYLKEYSGTLGYTPPSFGTTLNPKPYKLRGSDPRAARGAREWLQRLRGVTPTAPSALESCFAP